MNVKTKKQFGVGIVLCALFITTFLFSCKDDDKLKLLPEVTTTAVTEITTTTAVSGGEIISDGNDEITASGICWSTNTMPTVEDSKTLITGGDETFTSKLENLTSGTTYYVRAYATNSVGTSYGEPLSFMTGNAAPIAINVTISGNAEVNKVLTGSYTYQDENNDTEGATTLQWYRATDGSGTGEVAIAGATTATYKLQDTDEFKFIRLGVTPKATTGNTNGVEMKSVFVGPVSIRTTLTFIYNGSEVTYGIISSPVTGRKWLDRNLGAPNVANSYNDYINYGDIFQWGRGADGHQLVKRNAINSSFEPVNGSTSTLSASDVPGHSLFITPSSALPRDWRSPQNNNLWQGDNGANNPCPAGWHIPTDVEWDAENIDGGNITTLYTQLKLTSGSGRLRSGLEGNPFYWSSTSTVLPASTTIGSVAYYFSSPAPGTESKTSGVRGAAYVCRCIKDL